jgi:diguanylate cyclase (GGDEF)-like protein
MEQSETKKGLKDELSEVRAELKEVKEANNVLNERIIELYTLYNVSKNLSMSLQLNELFDITMNVIGESLGLGQYCLMLMDNNSGKLSIQASHGLPLNMEARGIICDASGVSWKVAKEGKPILISDISKEQDFLYFKESGIKEGSYLGVPLIRKDNKVIGVLSAHKTDPRSFGEPDLNLFKAVAEHVAVAIDNALTYQQTKEMMLRDELTNLYNRRYFFERFDKEVYRANRYNHHISLLMVDIDHFKNFNDSFGHLRGDEALKKLAEILEGFIRKADVLARYGGEEFLILLPETDKNGAASVGEKLRSHVESLDFNDDASNLEAAGLTITIGVASLPMDTDSADSLIDLADKALYYGKAQGRNQVCTEVPKKQ